MNHIDITIDLETLSLSPTAAILQIAAIPWHRDAKDASELSRESEAFNQNVDVRSCIMDGFTVDERTVKWWATQKEEVKESVFSGECHILRDTLVALSDWVADIKLEHAADTVCVWTQGTDFDIAILRNAYAFYGLDFPFERAYFRDARTYILEMGYMLHFRCTDYNLVPAKDIYKELPPMDGCVLKVHNALFDAWQSTWNVYHLMQKLNKQLETAEHADLSSGIE